MIVAKCLFISFDFASFLFVRWNQLLGMAPEVSVNIMFDHGMSRDLFRETISRSAEAQLATVLFVVIVIVSVILVRLVIARCINAVLVMSIKIVEMLIIGNLPYWTFEARIASWALLSSFAISGLVLILLARKDESRRQIS